MNAHSFSYTYGDRLPEAWGMRERVRGPGTHILACSRYPVRRLMGYDAEGNLDPESPRNRLPLRYVEMLEQNQQLASCCRHPENHDIEAWYSCEEDAAKGIPDIYILHCTCGRQHRRFCVGGGLRPFWEVR
jgi:hypothetical protein